MDEEKMVEKGVEDLPEKSKIIAWVKEHKVQLLFAGISITTLVATILGLKNKAAIAELWTSLKKDIEKGALYSAKWFEKASIDELYEARKIVQEDYLNPKLDMDYRSECWDLLARFDKVIGQKQWAGKEPGFPVHSEHGWHLPSKD